MLRSIFSTIATRFITAIISFAVVVYIARELGPEGNGTVSLIVLAVSINLIISNIVTAGMIYMIPRSGLGSLVAPAVLWSLVTSCVTSMVLYMLNLIPAGFFQHVILLSILQSWITIIQSILLGKQKIDRANTVTLLQSISLLASLFILFWGFALNRVHTYIWGLYVSYGLASALGILYCYRLIGKITFREIISSFIKLSRYGGFAQAAAVIQLFNYRLSYYLVESIVSRAALGIYSVGTQISEGMLIPAKSTAMVQYSAIANAKDKEYPIRLTLALAKVILVFTLMLEFVLVLLPETFYTWVFSRSFDGVKPVILFLAPGIVFLALSNILTHYFSGTGRHHQNTISSAVGFVALAAIIFTLTRSHGLTGAAIATSVAYGVSVIYQLIVFMKLTGSKFMQILPGKADVQIISELLKNFRNNIKNRKKN